LNKGKNA